MYFKCYKTNKGWNVIYSNDYGRNVEIVVKDENTLKEIAKTLEESKTNEEIEKEKNEKEKRELENKNQELKSSIESLIDRYSKFVDTKDDYKLGETYKVGDAFKYNGIVYAVVQNHTSQEDWKPDNTLSLYKVLRQTEEARDDAVINEWVQPTGSHDVYNTGDKVIYQGVVYESTIDNNSWSPIGYPQGWKIK